MKINLLLQISMLLFATSNAWSYPEMVRHGYVNCSSCHVSPTGGGVLTAYGRELSSEVLSTWSREGENKFAYFVNSPEWLALGGDFRGIQVYRNTPTFYDARWITMQADLEGAVNYKTFTLDASLGYNTSRTGTGALDYLISRRHYLGYRPSDYLSFRLGKFLYSYGINTPDHVISIKRALQMNDISMESYNLEAAWLGDILNVFVTAVLGRPSSTFLSNETGVAASASVSLVGTTKTGLSYFQGSNSTGNRTVFGPWAILGFTPRFFLLAELDFQNTFRNAPQGQWGMFDYMRLDYEFIQGLHGYLTQELSRSNFDNTNTLGRAYGIGAQFFPRPHFELNMSWQFQANPGATAFSDYAWFLAHFYL